MGKHIQFRDGMDKSAPTWAKRINKLLEEKNMTQGELAKSSNIAAATISKWLTGGKEKVFPYPQVEKLLSVAKVLNVSLDYLVGLTDSRKTDIEYQLISKKLGLSDPAIDILIKFKEYQHELEVNTDGETFEIASHEGSLDAVNALLEYDSKCKILPNIARFLFGDQASSISVDKKASISANTEIKRFIHGEDLNAVRLVRIQSLLHELKQLINQ